ncbi:hypothetical protein PFISCL1PPCAC_24458, partial [Pristionchus fissidentatus]
GRAQQGRIRVYPGPPPSEEEILAQFDLASSSKAKETETTPKSPFEKMEELGSLPSPEEDDRLPLEDLDDTIIISPSPPPSTTQTPSTTSTV